MKKFHRLPLFSSDDLHELVEDDSSRWQTDLRWTAGEKFARDKILCELCYIAPRMHMQARCRGAMIYSFPKGKGRKELNKEPKRDRGAD
jgi:hypothetical protein